jgi:XTP/dITP diphosphohydrolase
MRKIVLATRNEDKVREIRSILKDFTLLSLNEFPGAPEVEETGATLEENAVLKAESAAKFTGMVSLADDSGLEVEALGGLPGVRSARFAGKNAGYEDNNRKLLKLLSKKTNRAARFRCVICLCEPSGKIVTREGVCAGRIIERAKGKGGFGYDPVFSADNQNKTLAELSPYEKNLISHRSSALRKIKEYLEAKF